MNHPQEGFPPREMPAEQAAAERRGAIRDFAVELVTDNWREAREKRAVLREALLELGGYNSEEDFLDDVAGGVTLVYVAGGSATRWVESFATPEGAEVAAAYGIDRHKPRFLAAVPNPLDPDGPMTTIMDLNLLSERKVILSPDGQRRGKNVVISGKADLAELRAITERNGLHGTAFHEQQIRTGRDKPAGHADALLQAIEHLQDKEYVITHFGGDVTSPQTVTDALLALHVMRAQGQDIAVMVPSANMVGEENKYPILIDRQGLPRGLGHAKLLGEDSLGAGEDTELTVGGSNIGVRVYHGPTLRTLLVEMWQEYQHAAEFALDNVDQLLFQAGLGRQLCTANPNEIRFPGKTLPALRDQQAAWRAVLLENGF